MATLKHKRQQGGIFGGKFTNSDFKLEQKKRRRMYASAVQGIE